MRFTKALAIGIVAAMAAGLVACGGTKITELAIDPALTLGKGDTYQFEIAYKAKNEEDLAKINEAAKDYVLQWASSNELVATVDENGNVTAVDVGDAVITVSVKDHNKLTATCDITVENKVTGVNVATSMNLIVGGESGNINASVNPKDAVDYEICYESSDEKIATVDENGNVTAVAEGECVIKTTVVATTSDGEVVEEKTDSAAASSVAESNSAESVTSETTAVEDEKDAEEVLASAETKVSVKAAKAETAESTKDSKASASTTQTSNKADAKTSGSSTSTSNAASGNKNSATVSSGQTTSSSQTSGSGSGSQNSTPAAPTPAPATPAPAPVVPDPTPVTPDPAPAPDPGLVQPDPAPAPEPEQPSGGDNSGMVSGDGAGVGKDGNLVIEGGGVSEGDMGNAEYDDD